MASRQFYYAESLSESTTTSTTYGDKVALTWTPDANSDYVIIWSAKATNSSNITTDYKVRLFDDTGSATLCEFNIEAKDVSPTAGDYQSIGGMELMSFGASPSSQTVSIEFAAESGTPTIRISNATITAIKVHADDEYAESDGTDNTTSSTFQDKTTLTFTPASQGDYLIIATGEWHDPGSSNGAQYRVLDPASTVLALTERLPQDPTNWMPHNTIIKQNLAASSQTYKSQWRNIGADAGSPVDFRRSRIYAIRLDTLPDNAYGEARSRTTTTSTTYVDKATVTDTPAVQTQLRLACAIVDGSLSNTSHFFSFDQSGSLYEVLYEPSAGLGFNGTSTAVFTSSTYTGSGSSTTWKTQHRAEAGTVTAGIGESAVAILQLDEPATEIGPTIAALPPTSKTTRHVFDGWQAEPMPADVVVVEERSINRIITDVPPGLIREPHQGFQQAVVVADNDVSFSAAWLLPNPLGRPRDYVRDFQLQPLSDDNYESFSRVWAFNNPPGLVRTPHQGIQYEGERPDFFEQDQQTLRRQWTDVPDGLDRTPRFDGFQLDPLADDHYESFAKEHFALPPTGRIDPHSYDGAQMAPLADNHFESFTRTWTEVPPGPNPARDPWEGFSTLANPSEVQGFQAPVLTEVPPGRNPLNLPWDGFLTSPTPADFVPDTPALPGIYPDFHFPQFRREPHFIFDGLTLAPAPDDVVVAPGTGTTWRPTYMPRRR